MRWLALLMTAGCSIGNGSPAMSTASLGDRPITSQMLDRQNPSADTKNNKQLSRTEGAPPRESALAGWTEVAAGAFQILLGR